MIKKYIFLLLFCTTQLTAQTTYVPDDNFELGLISAGLDDVMDNEVLTDNLSGIEYLNLTSWGVSDVTGIEGFSDLIGLTITFSGLDSLDLSQVLTLEELNCENNNLTHLDVSSNTRLRKLRCANNKMKTLNIDNCDSLTVLSCLDNELSVLEIGNKPILWFVNCSYNQILEIDLTEANGVGALSCNKNNLRFLNLTGLDITTMSSLNCKNNSDLFCVLVDDESYSEVPIVSKDDHMLFSTDCGLGEEVESSLEITIYPNPASAYLYISINQEAATYKLLDLTGKLIRTCLLIKGDNQIVLDKLPKGIYFVEIKTASFSTTKKVIIT